MIEVEMRFPYTAEAEALIANEADLVSKHKNSDTYYDFPDFRLAKRRLWLRRRGEKLEFKKPIKSGFAEGLTTYEEVDDEGQIIQSLKLDPSKTLNDYINNDELIVLGGYQTNRTSYRQGAFRIDIDKTDFGYSMIEVELIVTEKEMIEEAKPKVMKFANSLGLFEMAIRGKLQEYLYRNNREVFFRVFEEHKF